MRKATDRRKAIRRSQNQTTPLQAWRSRRRPQILRTLVDQTSDLSWSRRLITLLLEELHVSDEFDDLVDSIDPPRPQQYPQLVAIAVFLRHSWFPEDLDRIAVWLGLPSTLLTEPASTSSPQSATADRTCGSTRATRSRSPGCTPQKGDSTC